MTIKCSKCNKDIQASHDRLDKDKKGVSAVIYASGEVYCIDCHIANCWDNKEAESENIY
jgi:hypothetical protein